jgi:hypothetical protein
MLQKGIFLLQKGILIAGEGQQSRFFINALKRYQKEDQKAMNFSS